MPDKKSETTAKQTRRTLDPELNALKEICWALEPLDEETRQRVLRYVGDKYPPACEPNRPFGEMAVVGDDEAAS